MLLCADGKYYTGHTDDLERRVGEHHGGGRCAFTSRRLPVKHVWSEAFGTRIEALEAERIVGGWSRAKKEALIAGDWSVVSHFAKPPSERDHLGPSVSGEVGKHEHNPPHPFVSSEVEKPRRGKPGFSTSLETNGGMEISRDAIMREGELEP